jgi:nucleoporin NUP82
MPSDDTDDPSSPQSTWLTPLEGPSTYMSLLGTEPYKPPPILSRPSGLPSNARLSLPSGSKSAEFMLTPDTLRYIGTTVAEFTSQIHEIQLAHRAAEARATLQKHELTRMSDKCRGIETVVEALKGPKRAANEERFDRVESEQKSLLGRLDRLLQVLMEKASPELSEHETKWFEELKRMKDDITGSGRYDDASLIARTRLVRVLFYFYFFPF